MKFFFIAFICLVRMGFVYGQSPFIDWQLNIGASSSFQGSNSEAGQTVSSDALGNVITVGIFKGVADFDSGSGVFNLTSTSQGNDGVDLFILKVDNSGNFMWAKSIPISASFNTSSDMVLDASGNIFITSTFSGTVDFDPDISTYSLTGNGAFILNLNPSGNFNWVKTFNGNVYAESICMDPAGNVYSTGHFGGTVDFDPNAGILNISSQSGYDMYISKLDISGNHVWAKDVGGTYLVRPLSITSDGLGDTYVTGAFGGTVDFDPGVSTYSVTSQSQYNIFILKLNPIGDFTFVKVLFGSNYSFGNSISVDNSGAIYITGYFGGTVDFDPGAGTLNLTAPGFSNVFILKLNSAGDFLWAKDFGTTNNNEGHSIAIDASANVYVTGLFQGLTDFDPGSGVYNLSPFGGYTSSFILKLDSSANFSWAFTFPSVINHCASISVDSQNNVYTTGYFINNSSAPTAYLVQRLITFKINQLYVGLIEKDNNNINDVILYPNPNNGSFKIQVDKAIKNGEFVLLNALGQKVCEQKIGQGENNIVTHSLAKGLYTYIILENKTQIANEKLAVE